MVAICTCGASPKNDKGLRKHQTLHCKNPTVRNFVLATAKPKLRCPDCDEFFDSVIGVSQHRRHVHPALYV